MQVFIIGSVINTAIALDKKGSINKLMNVNKLLELSRVRVMRGKTILVPFNTKITLLGLIII